MIRSLLQGICLVGMVATVDAFHCNKLSGCAAFAAPNTLFPGSIDAVAGSSGVTLLRRHVAARVEEARAHKNLCWMTASHSRGTSRNEWDQDWARFKKSHPKPMEQAGKEKVYRFNELRELCGPDGEDAKTGADSASNAISRLRRAVASDRTRDRQDDFRARWARQSPQRSLSAAQIEGAYGASMAIKQQQQQQQGLGVLSGARSLWRRMLTWSAIAFGLLTTLSLTITLSLATFSPKVAFASAPSSGVGGVETVVSRTV